MYRPDRVPTVLTTCRLAMQVVEHRAPAERAVRTTRVARSNRRRWGAVPDRLRPTGAGTDTLPNL